MTGFAILFGLLFCASFAVLRMLFAILFSRWFFELCCWVLGIVVIVFLYLALAL